MPLSSLSSERGRVAEPALLASILFFHFALNLHNLDHTGLTRWDEAYHAVVAQNVFKHPWRPTLVDVPYLPYNGAAWGQNHVWLHKPILPFWQIALSFALFGVDAFALRLPSALLSTVAVGLTYLIATELFERRTALVAAAVQALNPFMVKLVHGYQFADVFDVALLFWVEAGIYFLVRSLRTGAWRDVFLAGAAQGLAFLCKSYLAAIVFGLALTAWLLPLLRLTPRPHRPLGPVRLLGLLGTTVLVIAPWTTYCAVAFPDEFHHEHTEVWRHLYDNVENWGAPWDRVVFQYMIAIHGLFYTPLLVAGIVLVEKAIRPGHLGLWLTYAWAAGVIVPHLLAASKTPSATLLALPALVLLLAHLISEAWDGRAWPLAALTGVMAMCVLMPPILGNAGHGNPRPGTIMLGALWVVWHVAAAVAFAALVATMWTIGRRRLRSADRIGRTARLIGVVCCGAVLLSLAGRTLWSAWQVTSLDQNDPTSVEVGDFVREHLPANAVLLCEERQPDERLTLMFYADRTCYALSRPATDATARKILDAGGIPYIITHRRLPFVDVHVTRNQDARIYLWKER